MQGYLMETMKVPYRPSTEELNDIDVLVVGTGMGGATAGFELARLGRRVLFLEKGLLRHGAMKTPDNVLDGFSPSTLEKQRLLAGEWPAKITGNIGKGNWDFFAPVGCGSGGSTSMFAAALERLTPADFEPRRNFPTVKDANLPERWPISYDVFSRYYSKAEELFGVCGTQDPLAPQQGFDLRTPPELSARDQHFMTSFNKLGLHPYRIHVAFDFLEGCKGCVPGFCRRECKKDAAWTCLLPALQQHGARLLTQCQVTRLEADAHRVTGVYCRLEGQERLLRAKTVVLAAGAYHTPVVLLNSKSETWPDGLANRNGMVGRNLMFHAGEMAVVRPLTRASGDGPQKSLAINDFYVSDGEKLGTFQTIGAPVTLGHIMLFIRDLGERSPWSFKRLLRSSPPWWGKVTNPAVRAVAMTLFHGFNFRNAAIWASIVEDLPYLHNRILLDPAAPNGMRFEYTYTAELRKRVRLLRNRLTTALRPHRTIFITGDNNLNFGHVCGTCRFGDNPETSVLDRNNRAHGLANLFITDASFFPSSGGTNPSLTIAANALRVAGVIHADH
jgi:choline dehydrogenase-like flavoprotein